MAFVKTTWTDNALPAITAAQLNRIETGIGDAHASPGMRRQVLDLSAGATQQSVNVAQSDGAWRILLFGRIAPAGAVRYPYLRLNGAAPQWSRAMMSYAWANADTPTAGGPSRVKDNAGAVFGELGYSTTDGDLMADMILSGRPNNEGYEYAAHSRWAFRDKSGAANYEGGQVVNALEYGPNQGFPASITSLLVNFDGATFYGTLVVEPFV